MAGSGVAVGRWWGDGGEMVGDGGEMVGDGRSAGKGESMGAGEGKSKGEGEGEDEARARARARAKGEAGGHLSHWQRLMHAVAAVARHLVRVGRGVGEGRAWGRGGSAGWGLWAGGCGLGPAACACIFSSVRISFVLP